MRKVPVSMTRRQRHTQDERKAELYETPPVATRALLANERLPHMLWEASCGRGAIARVLRAAGHEVIATDLIDYKSPDQDAANFDFMAQRDLPVLGIDGIVQNPPFSRAAQFCKRSIELCPQVYMLMRLQFLEAGNEKTDDGRARLWVLDTGFLARVLVFRNRLPMMHRDGWDGPQATSTAAYAWFVFSWYHKGPAQVHRISWVPE